jgi:hypothetical protein
MARKRDTGDGEPYTEPEIDEVWEELEDAYEDYYGEEEEEEEVTGPGPGGAPGPAPSAMDVTAKVEWAGTVDENGRGGERKARIGGRGEQINFAPVIAAIKAARAEERRAAAGPLKSYRAKGWHAQLRQLMGTKRGRAEAERAGLAPSRETARRWAKGEQAPGRANREKITAAYEAARAPHATRAKQLRAEAVDKLTGAMRDTYGVNVRFRDIRDMRFR